MAVEVIPFSDSWIISSSRSHIHFEMAHLRELFRRCEEEALVFGFAHNHPDGFADFSDVDESNEVNLITAISNRNGHDIHFVALLLVQGQWRARVRAAKSPAMAIAARHVIIVGVPIKLFLDLSSPDDISPISLRQAAAFGGPFVQQLGSLRVGVVGAGGTGSPTITLLARSGVGELVIIDGDSLEPSNLNRVRGAAVRDLGKNKAEIIRDFIRACQLPSDVVAIKSLVDDDPAAVDALSSCDVIFGCTDDQIGRELLNTCLYVYLQAYIDVGLGGQVVADVQGEPSLKYHFGRVSTILPEEGQCLFCQGIISQGRIQREYALRENPDLTAAEAADRYIEGGGEQAPGVGPFTSAVADFGVATLFDLLRPFRRFPSEVRRDFFRIDFVTMEFRSNEAAGDPDCPYCRRRIYLLLKERYRLNRPKLGKQHAMV